MARYIYVLGGIVRNIVEHPTDPGEFGPNGEEIIADPTGLIQPGAAYDVTADVQDRLVTQFQADRILKVVAAELFRLTNESRALQALAPLTPAQYRAFIKAKF